MKGSHLNTLFCFGD